MDFSPLSMLLALLLSLRGLRKGSLSTSGAVAASLLGWACLANPLRVFGAMMIAHYLVGSRATKVKADVKASLEHGHSSNGNEGLRDARQVAVNSWLGVCCSLLHNYLYAGAPSRACSLDAAPDTPVNTPFVSSSSLVFVSVAFFAACLGDTLASELGILTHVAPRLITNFKVVPPGTNGAVTGWGTLCSGLGGLIIGLVAQISTVMNEPDCGFRSRLLWLGLAAGFLGSFIDSFLGATLQQTRYSAKERKILMDDYTKVASHEAEIKIISGQPILDNNAVNLISSTATGLLLGYAAAQRRPGWYDFDSFI